MVVALVFQNSPGGRLDVGLACQILSVFFSILSPFLKIWRSLCRLFCCYLVRLSSEGPCICFHLTAALCSIIPFNGAWWCFMLYSETGIRLQLYFAAKVALSVQWVPFWPHNWGKKLILLCEMGNCWVSVCVVPCCHVRTALSLALKCRSSLVFPCAAGLPGAWKCSARSRKRQQRRKYLLAHCGYFGTGLKLLENTVSSEILLLQRKTPKKNFCRLVCLLFKCSSALSNSQVWPKFWRKTFCVLCSAKLWGL